MDNIRERLKKFKKLAEETREAMRQGDAEKSKTLMKQLFEADAAGFNKANLIKFFTGLQPLEGLYYHEDLIISGIRQTMDPREAVHNIVLLIWNPKRRTTDDDLKKEIVNLLHRFTFADFYRLREQIMLNADTLGCLVPVVFFNCKFGEVPKVKPRREYTYMEVVDGELKISDKVLNATEEELAEMFFDDLFNYSLDHTKSRAIFEEEERYKACLTDPQDCDSEPDLEKLESAIYDSSIAWYNLLKHKNCDYTEWFREGPEPTDLLTSLKQIINADEDSFSDISIDDIPTVENDGAEELVPVSREDFLKTLNDEKKKKMLEHFSGIYECSELSEHEYKIAYLAWLWEKGYVHGTEVEMPYIDEKETGIDLMEYELTIEVEEEFAYGANLNITYDFYGFDKLMLIVGEDE